MEVWDRYFGENEKDGEVKVADEAGIDGEVEVAGEVGIDGEVDNSSMHK